MKIKITDGVVRCDGKTYETGDIADFKDAEAKRLIDLGVAEAPEVIVEAKDNPPSRMNKEELAAALTELGVEFSPDEKKDDLLEKLLKAKEGK